MDLENRILVSPKIVQKPNTFNVAIIGYGYWGAKLVRVLHSMPNVRLTNISDIDNNRLSEVQKLYPEILTTRNSQDVYRSDVDAVVIATPSRTHHTLAKEALLAGKHVLVEKPMALTSTDAEELIQIANTQNLTLMVGHTFLYNPAINIIRNLIQHGELGDIYYINAVRVNLGLVQPDINVIWDLAPHDISILLYILNADPTEIGANGACYVNQKSNLHEVAYLTLWYDKRVLVNLYLSWLDPVKQRKYTIVGSKKMLTYDDLAENKIIIYDKGVDVISADATSNISLFHYRLGKESFYPVDWKEPLQIECSHFIQCITTKQSPRGGGLNDIKVLKILESAQASLNNNGQKKRIDY